MFQKKSQTYTHSFDEIIPKAIGDIIVILKKPAKTADDQARIADHRSEVSELIARKNPFKPEYFKDINSADLRLYITEFPHDIGAREAATNRKIDIPQIHSPRKKYIHTRELITLIIAEGDTETQNERIAENIRRLKALETRGLKRNPKTYEGINDQGIQQYLISLEQHEYTDKFATKELERRKKLRASGTVMLDANSDDEFSDTMAADHIISDDRRETAGSEEDDDDKAKATTPVSSTSATTAAAPVPAPVVTAVDKEHEPKHGCWDSIHRLFASFAFWNKSTPHGIGNGSLRRSARQRTESEGFADGQTEHKSSTNCSWKNKLIAGCVVIAGIVISAAIGYLKTKSESKSVER